MLMISRPKIFEQSPYICKYSFKRHLHSHELSTDLLMEMGNIVLNVLGEVDRRPGGRTGPVSSL